MRWVVAKWEWGYLTTDHELFDDFDEACRVAKAHSHMNVLSEHTYERATEALHECSKKTKG